MDNFINTRIINIKVKAFIKKLVDSSIPQEKHLGMCILIELKFSLSNEYSILSTLNQIEKEGQKVCYGYFIKKRKKEFSFPYKGTKPRYSRVVDKETFYEFMGDQRFDTPTIDKNLIEEYGWSSGNGIVWVTPFIELNDACNNSPYGCNLADEICDHLGLSRDIGDENYYRVNYSPDFPNDVYQPNSSNLNWKRDFILFIPIKNNDNFGRTFHENPLEAAREQIHQTSYHFDEKYTASYLGRTNTQEPDINKVAEEAEIRFKQ